MQMDADEALSFITFLFEKDEEDKLFLRWMHGPQFSYSFDEFKAQLMPQEIKPDEEILDEVFEIIRKAGR